MDQNPQNQNNNNDLDSLLEEFQSLSTPVETPKPIETNNQGGVSNVPPIQTEPVQPNIPVQPVQNVQPIQPVQSNIVQQPSVQPIQPTSPQPIKDETLKSGLNNEENEMIHPDMQVKLNDLHSQVPAAPEIPTTSGNGTNETNSDNQGGGKNNLLFMIAIFLIMALFIFFIPKIDDLIKNKPGLEAKPTPTPTASAKPTATPEPKEEKMECSMPDAINGDVTTKTSYTYHSLNDKVLKTKKTVVTSFANIEGANQALYNQTKLTCNSLATTYAGVAGYTVTCEEKDNSFTIVYAFDLKSFTNPTTMTINGQQEIIQSDINLNDDIKTVKANMEVNGATCK